MESVNIAVIGASGAGKSTFIQRALSQTKPLGSNVIPLRLTVEGMPLFVTLVELDLDDLDAQPDQPIRWPKQVSGHMVPRIDGALMLYDVMNMDSIKTMPLAMGALSVSNLPTMLVATKCDNPENTRQLNTAAMPGWFPGALANLMTSFNVPSSTREPLNAIIKAALATKRGSDKVESAIALSRRRAASSAAHLEAPDYINGRPLSQHSKHSRASSDLSLLRGIPPPSASEGFPFRGQSRSPRMDHPAPSQMTSSHFGGLEVTDDDGVTPAGMLRAHGGVRLDTGRDTFYVDESDRESYRQSDDIPILQRSDENYSDRPAKAIGVSFDELVDRLLAPRMLKADSNFADIFLCLYRKFAPPHTLFSAIVARFEQVKNKKDSYYLIDIQTQLRIIEVMARWVSLYPGDFARSATRRKLEDLVRHLATEPIFAAAAHEMRWYLDHRIVEDDDTGWAESDEVDDELAESQARRPSAVAREPSLQSSGRGGGLNDSMSSLQIVEDRANKAEGRQAEKFEYHSRQDYELEAATMVPTSTLPLNKIRYHIFLDKDTDDIADEITRIDWIMFSSIGIRDLVRDVSLSMEEKERCRSLENVGRMIRHFNHVAQWVENMILIRDKPKHRVLCLEKFVQIASRLRTLYNYNGLAAVLAGLNSTPIYRLSQTWALLSGDSFKRFRSMSKLMGSEASHSKYRLAWENSPLPKIPYIPLLRRDLVSAEQGSRTFVGPAGDRINWKKFEVLGEVLLPLMRSQGTPYPNLRKDDGSRELILDCKMPTDEEDIYQRSVQVESGSGAGESRRRFAWLG